MGKKTELVKSLRKFAKEISDDVPVDSMYLFGSQATGKTRKGSDVDLILVSRKFRGERRLKRSPHLYMKWNLDYPVDFVCLTPKEFKEKKNQIGIVREAVRNGVKII